MRGTNELIKKGLLKLRDGHWRSDRELLLTDNGLDEIFGQDTSIVKNKSSLIS